MSTQRTPIDELLTAGALVYIVKAVVQGEDFFAADELLVFVVSKKEHFIPGQFEVLLRPHGQGFRETLQPSHGVPDGHFLGKLIPLNAEEMKRPPEWSKFKYVLLVEDYTGAGRGPTLFFEGYKPGGFNEA